LAKSKVKRVRVVGRRGPMQVRQFILDMEAIGTDF
jgi:hypothetical protein